MCIHVFLKFWYIFSYTVLKKINISYFFTLLKTLSSKFYLICLHLRNYFSRLWWQVENLPWWMLLKIFTHLQPTFHVIFILWKLLVQNARYLYSRIVKSMWYNCRIRTYIQIWWYEIHLQYVELICIDIPSFVDYVNQTWLSLCKEKYLTRVYSYCVNRYYFFNIVMEYYFIGVSLLI